MSNSVRVLGRVRRALRQAVLGSMAPVGIAGSVAALWLGLSATPAAAACGVSGISRQQRLYQAATGAYAARGLDVVFVGTWTRTGDAISAGDGTEPYGLFPPSVYTPLVFRVGAFLQGQPVESIQVLVQGGTLPSPGSAAANGGGPTGSGFGTTLSVEDTPTVHDTGWNLVLAHRNADGTFVAPGCTDMGAISDTEATSLVRAVRGAVVFDPAVTGALAGTGAPSLSLTATGLALAAAGTILVRIGKRRTVVTSCDDLPTD